MPFLDYARARHGAANCYLQTPLVVATDETDASVASVEFGRGMWWHPGITKKLKDAVAGARGALEALAAPAQFGRLTRSQLFVSDRGARSPLHFDQYDNVFCQLRGRKRLWLAPPRLARTARTYPVHHPLDAYARNDGDADLAKVHAVVLGPGDALVIPSHWWHAVQTLDDDCVSLNYWFSIAAWMLPPPAAPLSGDHLLCELSRQVEYLAADVLGADAVGGFLARLAADLAGGGSDGGDLPVRNYALHQLAALLGADRVADFCATFLHPDRGAGLPLLETRKN